MNIPFSTVTHNKTRSPRVLPVQIFHPHPLGYVIARAMPESQPISSRTVDHSLFNSVLKLSGAVLSICFTSVFVWVVRLPTSDNYTRPSMPPDQVYRLCHGDKTVSSELARDPTQSPSDVFHRLYKRKGRASDGSQSLDADEAQRATECGNWGDIKPSNLFLKVSSDSDLSIHWMYVLISYLPRYITMPSAH